MNFLALHTLRASDALAQLFNAYLKGLLTPTAMVEPRFVTMREVRTLFDQNHRREAHQLLQQHAELHYGLSVLHHSLASLHGHVLQAIVLLEQFFTDHPTGSPDPALHQALSAHFVGHAGRSEHIGSSGPADFAPFTRLVEQQSRHSLQRLLENTGNTERPLGELLEPSLPIEGLPAELLAAPLPLLSLGERVETDLNTDLRSEALVARFNATLTACGNLAGRYTHLPAGEAAGYRSLLAGLRLVRDGHPEQVAGH